jgi:hypothetical protein
VVLLVAAVAGYVLAGCIPNQYGDPSTYTGSRTLSIAVPSGNRTVPTGTQVAIEWHAFNDTGVAATVTLKVEARPSLAVTTLAGGLTVNAGQTISTFDWDTTSAEPGEYLIRGELVVAGAVEDTVTATGHITIDGQPEFAFTEPATDTSLPSGGSVTISWTARDPEGTAKAKLGLDPDLDHASGNEIFIDEVTLPADSTPGQFAWTGNDTSNAAVPAGTYNVFALVDDASNPVLVVTNTGRITVP